MRTIVIVLLLAISACSNAQPKTEKDMEQVKIKLKELIQQELAMVTRYPHQPAYYVQVNKNGCRIVVKVDDIPLGYNFAEDEGQSMLYPINDHLFSSGEHILSVEVFPLTTQQTISAGTWVNLKVILFPEKHGHEREMIAELNVPNDIGKQKLPAYCDSLHFKSTLPFDHKQILHTAKDLRKVSNLEAKVLAHYNKIREMMITGQYYEYYKMRLSSTWVLTDMHYLTEEDLESTYLDPNKLFRFNCQVKNWEIAPIENYKMVICGNGKLVYLQRIDTMDEVLRTKCDDMDENYEFTNTCFIILYMPQGSDELLELY
ncbi:hypothetical protein [uncultured Bacteroides sp.]|uniref:hypothetical protein n=1 Tax=uncultured Bacteroides sp. TaxID=162156 RepID=UPI0025FCB26B|nr:hypothetical protein [uncultured Bacteroides sp.]